MPSAKAWTALSCLFIFIAVCFMWMYLERTDRANAAYQEAKLQLDATRNNLESKKQSLESRQRNSQEIEAAKTSLKTAEDELADIDRMQTDAKKKESAVRAGIRETMETLAAASETRRSRAMSQEHPEIVLRTKKTFTGVKIHKIDENSIRFLHSAGTNSVEAWELPDSLQQELDIGPNSIMRGLLDLEASLEKPGTTSPTPAAEAPAPKGLTETQKTNLLVMKAELAAMEAKIRSVSASIPNFNQIAAQSDADADNAQARGVPSWNQRNAAQRARASASQGQAFIIHTMAECDKLRQRIQALENSAR